MSNKSFFDYYSPLSSQTFSKEIKYSNKNNYLIIQEIIINIKLMISLIIK